MIHSASAHLPYRLVRSRRRTLALVVTQAGELEVRAPMRARLADIQSMIERHRAWIARKLTEQKDRALTIEAFRAEEGHIVPVDGSPHRLAFRPRSRTRLEDGCIILPAALVGNDAGCRRAVISLLRRVTLLRMTPLVHDIATRCGVSVKSVRVTSAQRRWGSCSSRGSINFSYRLAQTPPLVQQYLAVHEVSHLRHPNHSRDFWDFVERLMPDYHEAERWLKTHGRALPF